ncbi:hypothetical protein SESBI_47851 [Sesbania bispinosa]|nr:hypothetical protein SESBI_47851 [Sesbania bispinosa]
MAKLLPWKNALLGLEATGGSPMDGEGDVGDGEDAGVGAEGEGGDEIVDGLGPGPGLWELGEGGDEIGEVAGGEVVGASGEVGGRVAVEAVGAGEGAWPVDIVKRARDMASMSMACVSAMASSSTEESWVTKEQRQRGSGL